jgi:signal transduction histidine kinase
VSDSDLLYQIFENLLSNAVKYSKDGQEVDFTVWLEKGNLKATVKDKGIGIPEKEHDQLYDRFFRAKNVGIIEGSGLGLSIVKKSLEVLNGDIAFESAQGKGTTFQISIPIQE